MFCKSRTIAYLILLFACFAYSSAFAQMPQPQNAYPETAPVRGIMPFTDQLSSSVDTIDPMSGKLSMTIPLVSLPPGRAGMGFELALTYDSNLYDVRPESKLGKWLYPPGRYEANYRLMYYSRMVSKADGYSGGWSYNFNNYGLYSEERPLDAVFDAYYRAQGYLDYNQCSEKNVEKYRLKVGLPDGSKHILYLPGYIHSVTDGYYGINEVGAVNSECTDGDMYGWYQRTGETLTYYTLDGTYLKVEVDTVNPYEWRIYFPDGKIIKGTGISERGIFDANGNGISTVNWDIYNPQTVGYDGIDEKRRFTISYNVDPNGDPYGTLTRDTITAYGPKDEPLTWAVDWGLIYIPAIPYNAYYPLTVEDPGEERFIPGYADFPNNLLWTDPNYIMVLKYLQLPSSRPEDLEDDNQQPNPLLKHDVHKTLAQIAADDSVLPVYKSYIFRYSGEESDTDRGIGGLNYMRTPTGSEYKYKYTISQDGIILPRFDPNVQYPQTDFIPPGVFLSLYGVFQKTVEYDDGIDTNNNNSTNPVNPDILTWNYGFSPNWDASVSTVISGSTIIQNPDGGQSTYDFGPYNPSLPGNSEPRVYHIHEADGTDRWRKWDANYIDCDMDCYNSTKGQNIYLARETVTPPGGNPRKSAVADYSYDRNGNLLSKTEYDWVDYTGGQIGPGQTVLRNTTFQYYVGISQATNNAWSPNSNEANGYWMEENGSDPWPPLGPRRLDAVQHKTMSGATTDYFYDSAYTKGNVTTERRWDNYLGAIDSTRSYDEFGNVTHICEPGTTPVCTYFDYDATRSRVTDEYQAYPTPLQRHKHYEWPYNSKRAIFTKTDVDNGLSINYDYDRLGRQTEVIEANQRRTTTSYDDLARKATVRSDLSQTNDQKLWTVTSYDNLGRVRLTQKTDGFPLYDESSGIKSKTVYRYLQGVGRNVVTSTPYRSTGETTLEWTCTQYDQGNRISAVSMFKGSDAPTSCTAGTNRTGITQTAYDSFWTTVTDPAGKVRQQRRDGLGRIAEVVEVLENPSDNYHTSYSYDPMDNLLQVTQGVQTRSFSYSTTGRLMWATNPESGTTYYTYELDGDLQSKTDARGVTTLMTYDELHRIRFKTYSDGTPTVEYGYHLAGTSSPPNIGRLKSVSSSMATTTDLTYNGLGQVTASTHSIDGYSGNLGFTYSWYLNGALSSVSYPTSRLVSYTVDDAGRTSSAYGPSIYANSITYVPDGRMAQMMLGNGLWETREYNTPGTPTNYKLGIAPGDGSKVLLGYNFSATDNNGNVLNQTITRGSLVLTQNYSYDRVNRVQNMTEGAISRAYGYDQYGNRWVTGSLSDWREPASLGNFSASSNRLTMSGITYDEAGNQTAYNGFTIGYDAENRITSMTSGSGSDSFYYDGDSRRVKKVWTSGGTATTTYYVYDALGRMSVEYSTEAPVNPGTSYLFTDMLGSVRAITSSDQQVRECYDYLPFGRMLGESVNGRGSLGCYPTDPDNGYSSRTPQKFTGKERDQETGLDYFGARYYSGAQGRFLSVDPENAGAKREDPQSWNAYAYSRNNPLLYTDPDGTTYTVTGEDGSSETMDDFYFWNNYWQDSYYEFMPGSDLLGGSFKTKKGLLFKYSHVEDVSLEILEALYAIWRVPDFIAENVEKCEKNPLCGIGMAGLMMAEGRKPSGKNLPFKDMELSERIGKVLGDIVAGVKNYKKDGKIFKNLENKLPAMFEGYYKEYTVATPGAADRGTARIVTGSGGEVYFTPDHYKNFVRIK